MKIRRNEPLVEYVDNQKPQQAALKWDGEIGDATPVGFTKLRLPDDVEPVLYDWTTCVVIFDRDYQFAQFPLTAVNEDGTVELGPALPFKVPKSR
jgi:hypothetical protein